MNCNSFIFTGILCLSILSTAPSYAGLFSKKSKPAQPTDILNINMNEEFEQQQRMVLNTLATHMNLQLSEIQKKIDNQDVNGAMALAKITLDDVKSKSGIDPKVKLRESFLVPLKIPQGVSDFSQLNENERNTVIKSIKDFRGGLYLEIINLVKRTTLLYIKALHLTVKKDGVLLRDARDKILRDLTMATIFPFYIKDESGSRMVVFEDDVVDEDHIFLFNYEIQIYLLNSPDLEINEKSFSTYRQDVKNSILQKERELNKPISAVKLENAKKCMNQFNTTLGGQDRSRATLSCFNKHVSELQNYSDCIELAQHVHDYFEEESENHTELYGGNVADAITAIFELRSPVRTYTTTKHTPTQNQSQAKKVCVERFK